jgi:3-oxoacyl-[acyl-carrier-protein] synthase II
MRVAVTGVGAITPVGLDAPATWSALVAGRSGVRLLDEPWATDLPIAMAAMVDAGYTAALSPKELRRLDRAQQFALLAGREAWRHAGLVDVPGLDRDRVAVVVGSAIGGLGTTLAQQENLRTAGARRVSPHTVTMMMANGAAAWLSLDVDARAGARAPVSACASGSEALLMAREMILAGSADVVLAGGTEACVTGLTLAALAQARALSHRTDDPTAASRPFDTSRDGFVLGEGAAVLTLESEEHARARGATVLAWLSGASVTSDAYDIVAGSSENQARTMTVALRQAGLQRDEVGFVHAHATSTPLGDVTESRAILAAAGAVPVTSSKSMVGHLLGASGALGAVLAVQAMGASLLPATINVTEVDPEIGVDVVRENRPGPVTSALVNAFGFGGHNVSLVLESA